MRLVVEILPLLVLLALLPLMTGIVSCRAAEWCLNRRLNILVYPALAVLGVGTVCGLLRLSGVIVFPSDHTWSVDFFDASWRDDGVRLLRIFAGPLAGGIIALFSHRRNGKKADGN